MPPTTGELRGRPTVFISYSQKDEAWKDRVVGHLKVLEVEGELAVWDDKRIAAGEAWWPEIEGAMNRAAVALLLISKDFLTSGFIRGTEVPRLLARRQTEGLRVIPVFVHPCAWEAVDWLAALQGRPGKGRTLSEARKPQIEKHLSALALEIRDLLSQLGQRAADAAVERAVKPSSRPAGERRQVTVVCCELVGMDGPAGPAAFDPEELQELMLQLRSLAEGVTRRYDGHLGNVLGGQRLLICFGYPQAHEDNAQRAVRAALELAEQVAQRSAVAEGGRPVSLALRVGIHTGSAVVVTVPSQGQEPVTLGATLDLAVELQSLAAPGQVIVSPATASLIGKSFALEALPAAQAPGRAPLIPRRVLELVDSQEAGAAGLLPLVGRDQELELLLSRWALAREGKGQVILISGEAGMGKSRLVRALRERLEEGTAQWWSCFGSPYTQGSPLQPVVDLLRQVLLRQEGASPLDRLASALGDLGLADAVPLFAPLLDLPLDERHPALPLSPERQRERTLEALVTLVLEMAERQPLVFLIEDLHWLDPTSLDCLSRLIDQMARAPLLLLMTLRLNTLEVPWGPRSHLTQVTLAPLNETEAATLVERVLGEQALPAEVRRQIVARTDGVPLFLEELTKVVVESHASGERQELPAMPTTLRDSLAARLDRLGAAKQVAQIAAVIGRNFSFELLAAVCSLDEGTLQQELQRLVQAELVYRKGFGRQARYLFKHALVQDAAYESLLKRERQQLHRRIAETLAARFADTAETTPEILAHHYPAAGRTEPAIDFWVRAGALANRRLASAEALGHLDRALRLLQSLPEGPQRDRRELSIQTFRAPAVVTGRGHTDPEVEQTYARAEVLAERLAEAEERFWAVRGLHFHCILSGKLAQALDLAERLLQIAESEGSPTLLSIAWFALGGYHCLQSRYAQALSELERACELAPPDDYSFLVRTGEDHRVIALSLGSYCLSHLGQLDRARHRMEQATALARQLRSPFTVAIVSLHAAYHAQSLGDVETVRRLAQEVYDLGVELDFSHLTFWPKLLLVWSDLVAPVGGLPAIELDHFDSLQRLIAQYGAGVMAYFFSLHAEILLLRGRPGDAWRALDEGLRVSQACGVSEFIEEIYRLQGEILLKAKGLEELPEGDRPAEAERRFQAALELARRHGSRLLELRAALSLGRLWKNQGRTQDAHELVAQARQSFTEGSESGDLREARAFLDSCSTEEE